MKRSNDEITEINFNEMTQAEQIEYILKMSYDDYYILLYGADFKYNNDYINHIKKFGSSII
jgi:hypothetical protein